MSNKHTVIEKICLLGNENSSVDDCILEALSTGIKYKINVELNYNGDTKYRIDTVDILRTIHKSGEAALEEI